ncbi:MAG: hypothetical protein K8R41_08190 [Bacteroidales bacterium]|nr:hypothetical protein [Bacteroidales bacterium]
MECTYGFLLVVRVVDQWNDGVLGNPYGLLSVVGEIKGQIRMSRPEIG